MNRNKRNIWEHKQLLTIGNTNAKISTNEDQSAVCLDLYTATRDFWTNTMSYYIIDITW